MVLVMSPLPLSSLPLEQRLWILICPSFSLPEALLPFDKRIAELSAADSSSLTSTWYVPACSLILMRRVCGSR